MCKVLIVEDDLCLLEALKERLEQLGHSTLFARNGRDALFLLQRLELTPDLILTNWDMPIMGGQKFIEQLKINSNWAAIPVVVVSGSPQQDLPAGVCWLTKPLNPQRLQAVLNSYQ